MPPYHNPYACMYAKSQQWSYAFRETYMLLALTPTKIHHFNEFDFFPSHWYTQASQKYWKHIHNACLSLTVRKGFVIGFSKSFEQHRSTNASILRSMHRMLWALVHSSGSWTPSCVKVFPLLSQQSSSWGVWSHGVVRARCGVGGGRCTPK